MTFGGGPRVQAELIEIVVRRDDLVFIGCRKLVNGYVVRSIQSEQADVARIRENVGKSRHKFKRQILIKQGFQANCTRR